MDIQKKRASGSS
jgi:DNA polymerase delta subunit 1